MIVLLGGTSDIGLAIVRELLSPTTRAIVLYCRVVDADRRAAPGCAMTGVASRWWHSTPTTPTAHGAQLEGIATAHGDIDVVIDAGGAAR